MKRKVKKTRKIGFKETLAILDKDPVHLECHTRCSTSIISMEDIIPINLTEEEKIVKT
jgi:hypothetical protein